MIDANKLLAVIYSSLVAGIGVTVLFGFVIHATSRGVETYRSGRRVAAGLCLGFGVVALAAFIAAVGYGVLLVGEKS